MSTTTAPFTFGQFVDALFDAAETKPSFVYPAKFGCAYVPDGNIDTDSRCIIGEVLIGQLGVLDDEDFRTGPFADLNMEGVGEVLPRLGVYGQDLLDVANTAQTSQDTGQSWASAVTTALSTPTVRAVLTSDQIARLSVLEAQTQMERLV